MVQTCVVPLNHPAEAMSLFQRLLIPFVVEVRGERVYCDIGDYREIRVADNFHFFPSSSRGVIGMKTSLPEPPG